MRRYGFIAAILLPTLALFPSAGSAAGATAEQQMKEGMRLFTSYCVVCHGETGKGNGPLAHKLKPPPVDLADYEHMRKRSDKDLYRIIEGRERHGQHIVGMPEWGQILNHKQIQALAGYVRYLHRNKYPTVDDPDVGQAVYEDFCASCHGRNGKGKGVLTQLMPITPTDHTDTKLMGAFTDKRLTNIITNGDATMPYMPAWKGILTESEIEAVVRYIRALPNL
jgi:cytochrome c oxidase cbb3-type subunit 3